MKIPLSLYCDKCSSSQQKLISLTDTHLDWRCRSCGEEYTGPLPPDFIIGEKLLLRSSWEYRQQKDYNLSIVFSAMAVECEFSRLFIKWSGIKALQKGKYISDDKLEEQLRKFWSLVKKFKKVTEQMYPAGVVAFIKKTPELKRTVSRFPSIGLSTFIKDVQEKLFWKRNKILHFGNIKYGREDAAKCYGIAFLAIFTLNQMDKWRRQQEE